MVETFFFCDWLSFWNTLVLGAKKWYCKRGKGFVHNWCQPSGEKCTCICTVYCVVSRIHNKYYMHTSSSCNLFTHGAPGSSKEHVQKCLCIPGLNSLMKCYMNQKCIWEGLRKKGCKTEKYISLCFYPKTWWWTQSLPWMLTVIKHLIL